MTDKTVLTPTTGQRLPAQADPGIDTEAVKDRIESRAPNTRKNYESRIADFNAFRSDRPINDETIRSFLNRLATRINPRTGEPMRMTTVIPLQTTLDGEHHEISTFVICLISLSALRCGDSPLWSNDLGITVESAQVETQTFGDALDNSRISRRLRCVIILSKEGRSFTEDERVRLIVEFFDGDISLKADTFEVEGLPGNGARTEVRGTFAG